MLRHAWTLWTDETTNRNRASGGANAAELELVKGKIVQLHESTTNSARRVMARFAGDNAAALSHLYFHAWMDVGRSLKQDKQMECAVKDTEAALKKHLDDKKLEARHILDKLAGASNTGLMSVVMQNWTEYVKEEKDAMVMHEALYGQDHKFRSFAQCHRANAYSVQRRVNAQADLNVKQRVFSSWALEKQINCITSAFSSKYKAKKCQLEGVQNLFKSFAMQLEQNLGGDDEECQDLFSTRLPVRGEVAASHEVTARSEISARSERYLPSARRNSRRRSKQKGMARDNAASSSLPDIHSRGGVLV